MQTSGPGSEELKEGLCGLNLQGDPGKWKLPHFTSEKAEAEDD